MRKHFSLLECINYYHLYSLSNSEVWRAFGSHKNSFYNAFYGFRVMIQLRRALIEGRFYISNFFWYQKPRLCVFASFSIFFHISFSAHKEIECDFDCKRNKVAGYCIFKYNFYECLLPHPVWIHIFTYNNLFDVLVSHYDCNIWLIGMYRELCRFVELIWN